MLVTGNSTKADKPVTKSALTLQPPPPLSISALFYSIQSYLKLYTKKNRQLRQGFKVTPGNRTLNLPHKRRRTYRLYESLLLKVLIDLALILQNDYAKLYMVVNLLVE